MIIKCMHICVCFGEWVLFCIAIIEVLITIWQILLCHHRSGLILFIHSKKEKYFIMNAKLHQSYTVTS
jgi:hypothetical protein